MRRPTIFVAGSEIRAHWDASRDGTIGDRLIANVPCQSTGKGAALFMCLNFSCCNLGGCSVAMLNAHPPARLPACLPTLQDCGCCSRHPWL